MPIGPQQVYNPTVEGDTIPGLTEETVNIAGGLISSITDLDLNVLIGDDRDIFFGHDLDFSIGLSSTQDSLEIRENLLDNTVLEIMGDGSLTMSVKTLSTQHEWQGNLVMTNRGIYARTSTLESLGG